MRKRIVMMMVGVALLALPATAQNFGTPAAAVGEQKVPTAAFQSTSVMTGSGSQYSATPALNEDGTATYEGASYSPAKAPAAGPAKGPRKENWTIEGDPIGDAVLPLMLMAGAFAGVVYLRRRKAKA